MSEIKQVCAMDLGISDRKKFFERLKDVSWDILAIFYFDEIATDCRPGSILTADQVYRHRKFSLIVESMEGFEMFFRIRLEEHSCVRRRRATLSEIVDARLMLII